MSQHPMDGVPEADSGTPSGLPGFVTSPPARRPIRRPTSPHPVGILGQLLFIAAALVLPRHRRSDGGDLATGRARGDQRRCQHCRPARPLGRHPALTDSLVDADPAAIASLDQAVRRSVLPNNIVRVKVWRPDGTVVYADDHRLIRRTFVLDVEQQETLSSRRPAPRSPISAARENEFERYLPGRLLEVYRPVWTPTGTS